MNKHRDVYDRRWYDRRWKASMGTNDEDILALNHPRTQIEFFYYQYNSFISNKFRFYLGDCTGKKLLEFGCGRATSSIFQALTLGVDIYPTDHSGEALRIASRNVRKYGLHAMTKQAELHALPYIDGCFDMIISLGVMEHIEDLDKAFKEMYRLLKKGGVMICMNVPERPDNVQRFVVMINRILDRIVHLVQGERAKPWLDKKTVSKSDVYRSELSSDEFANNARKSGFEHVQAIEANPFPTFSPVPRLVDLWIVKVYELVLLLRHSVLAIDQPFTCSARNSRVHFIVANKA